MFARTDRLPPWISAHERADVYPVEVRRDPSELEGCGGASKRTSPTGAGIRCSTPRSGRALSSDRARRVRGDDEGTAGPRVRRGGESRVGARPLLQRHPAAGCADRGECRGNILRNHRRARASCRGHARAGIQADRRDALFPCCFSIPRCSRSIRRPISSSDPGPSPRARRAIRRSSWRRAAHSGASSSWAPGWRLAFSLLATARAARASALSPQFAPTSWRPSHMS